MTHLDRALDGVPRPLLVALALFAAACVGGGVVGQVADGDGAWRDHQGRVADWWGERGLVVPHETFPADCTLCHERGTWTELREDFDFDHFARTGVPLEGAHAAAQCLRCHNDRGPAGEFAARGCRGCHVDVHLGQRGTSCANCHTQVDWQVEESVVAHAATRFPLVGPHAAATCRQCHLGIDGGVMEPLDVDCASCHAEDLVRATDPDHVALGWTSGCDDCHAVAPSFGGIGFTHSAYRLTGAHVAADCADCHGGGQFSGTPRLCVDCHFDDYAGASDPDHQALMFSTSCEECHTTSSWDGASFDHSSWSLTGAHAQAACASCHASGTYAGTPTECVGCHLADYQSALDPDHVTLGFPTTCQDCHGTSSWGDAMFDHSSWALDGAHATTSCSDCHVGGVYAGTPTECVDCHLADYQGTTDPDHDALGFPTTCESCHDTSTWTGATFDHVWFPIVGGDHGGLTCTECHQVSGDPSQFSCIHCHDHRRSEMDDEHDDVPGYVWSSPACYQCHPNGQELARHGRGAILRRRLRDQRPARPPVAVPGRGR